MPMTQNIDYIVGLENKNDDHLRTLILSDVVTGQKAWINFNYPYSNDLSLTAIKALFDTTLGYMLMSGHFPTREDLPIIRYIGYAKITIIIRDERGNIEVKDALSKSIDGHLGIDS